jgi:hypothetical protein
VVVAVGVAMAPSLLKRRAFRVFVPVRVSVPPPLIVTVDAAAIWPELVTMVSTVFVAELTPLITMSPGITTLPAAPLRFVVPCMK